MVERRPRETQREQGPATQQIMKKHVLLIGVGVALVVLATGALKNEVPRRPADLASPQSELRDLSPIQAFARISEEHDADEGRYQRTDSFLSKYFKTDQPLAFRVGEDPPGQPRRGHPFAVAASHDGKKVYVSLPGSEAEPLSRVAVMNPDTGKVIAKISTGSGPFGLTMHPRQNLLVVTHLYSNYVTLIDTDSDTVVKRLPLLTDSGDRYYAQKAAFYRNGRRLVVTNRMTDSLLVYDFGRDRLNFVSEISLSVRNVPIDTGNEPKDGPYNISADNDHLDPAIDGLSVNANPPRLERTLVNTNPRDVVVLENVSLGPLRSADVAYIANVNGLGVSIVNIDIGKQIGSIDLNSPALGLVAYGDGGTTQSTRRRFVFVATASRFAGGLSDVASELAAISVDEGPLSLYARFTSLSGPPVGPSLGLGTLVPATGDAPYLSAFAVPTGQRGSDATNASRDRLPEALAGSTPFQLCAADDFLFVTYASSDQVEMFAVNSGAARPSDLLIRKLVRFTNSDQVAFPTARLQTRLTAQFNSSNQLEYALNANGNEKAPGPANASPLTGADVPRFFDGRHPAGIIAHPATRRLYVANRLGESVSAFDYSLEGFFSPARVANFDLRPAVQATPAPRFPATLAELGEDFYTSSRVTLSRQLACLSCHPDINTDSKSWAVSAAPGGVRRRVQTNRNLRDTPPYGAAGSRSNLEICARNLRSFVPDNFFGASLPVDHPAFRDANRDGRKDGSDLGRPQADVNRDAMYVLERAGIGFEYVCAAIAAFLEVEPRLVPNPFLNVDPARIPLRIDAERVTYGDARHGARLFQELKCIECHSGSAFTNNRTFTRFAHTDRPRTLKTTEHSSVLFAVVPSHEESILGIGSVRDMVDSRLLPRGERTARFLPAGSRAFPLERALENSFDSDDEVFTARTHNVKTFTYEYPAQLPVSPFSQGRVLGGRMLANEPHFLSDPDVNDTGADGRNINVPSLRNAWENAPYLHHGRAPSIYDVVNLDSEFHWFRNAAGEIANGPVHAHGDLDRIRRDETAKRNLTAFIMTIQ